MGRVLKITCGSVLLLVGVTAVWATFYRVGLGSFKGFWMMAAILWSIVAVLVGGGALLLSGLDTAKRV